jgi:hypothetical protein
MRVLFWLSVFISGMITVTGFVLTNMSAVTLDPGGDNYTGGNGNPGLMFVVFPSLIIMYFFFAMMFVMEKVHERFSIKRRTWQIGYAGAFFLIVGFSIYRIVSFRNEAQQYVDYELGYLSPFSNDLFFNAWTFIACLCAAGFFSMYLKKGGHR